MIYAPHAVYLMKNLWSESNYKIGFSNRPSRRRVEVDDQYNVDPKLLGVCWLPTQRDARHAELQWHRYFSDYRSADHAGREWFALTQSQVDAFLKWCSHSPEVDVLRDDLFMGRLSRSQISKLTRKLFKYIPRKNRYDSVDVWRLHDLNNDNYSKP